VNTAGIRPASRYAGAADFRLIFNQRRRRSALSFLVQAKLFFFPRLVRNLKMAMIPRADGDIKLPPCLIPAILANDALHACTILSG
jgi:hypothetical protein